MSWGRPAAARRLARIIAGFPPNEGRVLRNGADVTSVRRTAAVNGIQRPAPFPHLDVGENVAFSGG